MLESIASNQAGTASHKDFSHTGLEETCAEFESIFITYLLKSMRATVVEDGILENNNESKIINSMFDENLARSIAKKGGIGLGEILFERLNIEKLNFS